jgi:hypothetical protein
MKKLIILLLPFFFFTLNAQNTVIETDIHGFESIMTKFISGSENIFTEWWTMPDDPYLTPEQNRQRRFKAREEAQQKVRIYYTSFMSKVYSVKFKIYKSIYVPVKGDFNINNSVPGTGSYSSDLIKFPPKIDKCVVNYFIDSKSNGSFNIDILQEGVIQGIARQYDISNPADMIVVVQFKLCGNEEFMPEVKIDDVMLYRGTNKIPIFLFTRKISTYGSKPKFDGHSFISDPR